MFINPEHYTSCQLLSGVLLLGEGEAFKYNISLPLQVPGMIIPQKGSHSLVCYLGWTLSKPHLWAFSLDSTLCSLGDITLIPPVQCCTFLISWTAVCNGKQIHRQVHLAQRFSPKAWPLMICVHFYLFYICDDVNTSLADFQKSTLLVTRSKTLDPLKGQQATACVLASRDMSRRPCEPTSMKFLLSIYLQSWFADPWLEILTRQLQVLFSWLKMAHLCIEGCSCIGVAEM